MNETHANGIPPGIPERENAGEKGGNEENARVFFDAVLFPHRSLGATGFLILMTLICVVSFITGLAFTLMGAWPVTGFFGLDVLLIYIAFRLNYRSARTHETLRLTRDALRVERHLPSGRVKRWNLQPAWLRVEMDSQHGRHSTLNLTSHGKRLAIGSFLSGEERLDLARSLRAALMQCRGG